MVVELTFMVVDLTLMDLRFPETATRYTAGGTTTNNNNNDGGCVGSIHDQVGEKVCFAYIMSIFSCIITAVMLLNG
jgi:hypothetical protein